MVLYVMVWVRQGWATVQSYVHTNQIEGGDRHFMHTHMNIHTHTHHLAQQAPRLVEQKGDEADVLLVRGRVHVADDEEGGGLGIWMCVWGVCDWLVGGCGCLDAAFSGSSDGHAPPTHPQKTTTHTTPGTTTHT